jgi:hypothetical protein
MRSMVALLAREMWRYCSGLANNRRFCVDVVGSVSDQPLSDELIHLPLHIAPEKCFLRDEVYIFARAECVEMKVRQPSENNSEVTINPPGSLHPSHHHPPIILQGGVRSEK